MDAGWYQAARILNGDTPEIPHAKRIRTSPWQRSIMQIKKILVQIVLKTVIICSSIEFEKFGARFWNLHPPD
jgi:hypothetical protein